MEEFPRKLTAYLNTLNEEEKDEKARLFHSLIEEAQAHKFQSPRFWAMRQILSGRSLEQIKRNIKKRVTKKTDRFGERNDTG
ncbi:general glycosylation pathway protein [Candidatus Scalindua japonica]|uniref:General glycosylation pathway protein n=1 Tax=Candidatus Scalindua japonica TaxID=1284222 RepID=A0A286U2N2_9BACT|nr:hypothetical protein [Candidatus Scalindua japonica]GAX62392.1 general glycosylation pathway protein [Candidatus Scalindua japonica]